MMNIGKEDNFLMPTFMLLLLIISAAITGALVPGKAVYWLYERFEE